jgi:geranylgeranyl pyrophosphate synthase
VTGEIDDDDAVAEVVRAIRESGALDEATRIAAAFADQAKQHIGIVPDAETREMLIDVAELAWTRHA